MEKLTIDAYVLMMVFQIDEIFLVLLKKKFAFTPLLIWTRAIDSKEFHNCLH